jgi:hypothetical protein
MWYALLAGSIASSLPLTTSAGWVIARRIRSSVVLSAHHAMWQFDWKRGS